MSSTILIVDDHEGVRSAIHRWIEFRLPFCLIFEADDAESAISKIQENAPQLVIMDFKLPGINGIEATRRIKSIAPSTQVIMLTIREDEAYQIEATAAGVSAYVTKRTMGTELIPALNTLLSDPQGGGSDPV